MLCSFGQVLLCWFGLCLVIALALTTEVPQRYYETAEDEDSYWEGVDGSNKLCDEIFAKQQRIRYKKYLEEERENGNLMAGFTVGRSGDIQRLRQPPEAFVTSSVTRYSGGPLDGVAAVSCIDTDVKLVLSRTEHRVRGWWLFACKWPKKIHYEPNKHPVWPLVNVRMPRIKAVCRDTDTQAVAIDTVAKSVCVQKRITNELEANSENDSQSPVIVARPITSQQFQGQQNGRPSRSIHSIAVKNEDWIPHANAPREPSDREEGSKTVDSDQPWRPDYISLSTVGPGPTQSLPSIKTYDIELIGMQAKPDTEYQACSSVSEGSGFGALELEFRYSSRAELTFREALSD